MPQQYATVAHIKSALGQRVNMLLAGSLDLAAWAVRITKLQVKANRMLKHTTTCNIFFVRPLHSKPGIESYC